LNHNKISVPKNSGEKITLYSKIIRDADKIDILRILSEHYKMVDLSSEGTGIDLSNVENIIMELHYYFEINKRTISIILEKLEKEGFYYIIYPNTLGYLVDSPLFLFTLIASRNKEKIIKLMEKRNIFSKAL